jgi:alkylation response protein AidB-like acyl-CoA dehydrogenase
MHAALTEEQRLIGDMARKFAITELEPIAAQLDRNEDSAKNRQLFLANLQKLAELGFMGLNVNADYGGTDAGVVSFSLAITEIARACASTAVTMSVTNMVGEVIQSVANEEQKQQYLPKLLSGDYAAGSFCLSEQGAGSDPAAMKTKAVKEGDSWVVNGTKAFRVS